MSQRIENMFARCAAQNRTALAVYLTMGCPTVAASQEIAAQAIRSGADLLELGVPFSDPMADGPVIQTAGQIALKNGAALKQILTVAANLRRQFPDTPMVLFSYYNVLLNHGLDNLAHDAAQAGIDALLVVDLPMEERQELLPFCQKYDLGLIPLLSPATNAERAKAITKNMKGFAYCITVRGVTGVRRELPPELLDELHKFKIAAQPLPIAAGFGISTPEMVRQIAPHAQMVVVGSAAVNKVLQAATPQQAITDCGNFIADLAAALYK